MPGQTEQGGKTLFTQRCSFNIAASKERFSLLAEAEKILLDEMPLIPLNQAAMLYLHQDKIKGVSISSMGNMELKWAYFDE